MPAPAIEQEEAARRIAGEDLTGPCLEAPPLLVWLGDQKEITTTAPLRTINQATGEPDLAITLVSIRRDEDGNETGRSSFGRVLATNINNADCFLRIHSGQAFRCPDGILVDQTRMQKNLSLIHKTIREHLEGKY